MRKTSLAGLILFFMFLPWQVAWAGPTSGGLLGLLPPEAREGRLTRGGFAVMLAAAANLKVEAAVAKLPRDVPAGRWYAPALQGLWQEGMIYGYPGGALRPEQEITTLEAVILTARVLGLPNEISAPPSELQPGDIPYGFNQYAFFHRQGLLPPGAPGAILTPAAAADWLAAVFGSEIEAKNLMDKCRQALSRRQGIATTGEAVISFHSRPGLPATMELDRLTIRGRISNEVLLPARLRQVAAMELEGRRSLVIEQVAADGNLYRRVTDSAGQPGSGSWQHLQLAPDVPLLMRQQQNLGLPAGIYPHLHYRSLGRYKIAGREVLGISFYTRLNQAGTITDFLPAAALSNTMAAFLDQQGGVIRAFSYWGLIYVDPATLLPARSDLNLVLTFAPASKGRPAPVTAMEMRYRVDKYAYDDIRIDLPVAAAPVK